LKLPEGSSKLEDQGWYLDPSTQLLGSIFRFVVSPIQTGKLTLPTLLLLRGEVEYLGRTKPYSINVAALEQKDGKPPELLEPTPTSLPTKYWIIFSTITLGLALIIFYFIRRHLIKKRNRPQVMPVLVREPDHVIALKLLNSLYSNTPYSLENLKPIAFGVSDILKEFFSSRFKIDASESTTDEMIELLRKQALPGENLREIQVLFQDLDLVKFTKKEHYTAFDESKYQEFKVKAQTLIQKWTLVVPEVSQ
jgi:hypothetical protein